jgi:hypothetical protein
VLELDEAEVLEQRRHIHGEAAAIALAEPVPPADRIRVGTSQASRVPSLAALFSSALPSFIQSPRVSSTAGTSSRQRAR